MKKKKNTDALNCLKTKEKKSKKIKIKDADLQIDEAVKNRKIKTMIEFDKNECNGIKSIVIKRQYHDQCQFSIYKMQNVNVR